VWKRGEWLYITWDSFEAASGSRGVTAGAYLGHEKTKEGCAGVKADKNRQQLADFERGCVPLQNQQVKFSGGFLFGTERSEVRILSPRFFYFDDLWLLARAAVFALGQR
jgi:hypothetical protein